MTLRDLRRQAGKISGPLERRFEDLLVDRRYRDDLLDAVRRLARRHAADLERIHALLADAKRSANAYSRRLANVADLAIPWDEDGRMKTSGGQTLRGRQWTRGELIRALQQARAFYDQFLPDSADSEPIYRGIRELLILLEAPPTFDNFGHLLGPNVPRARQARRGPPVRPDRGKSRADLRAAGVPLDLVNPLLRYVGVLPATRP